MTFTEVEISDLEKIGSKHPIVKQLFDDWKIINESPYLEGYLTIYRQITSWNNEIETKSKQINLVQVNVKDEEGNIVGTVDKTFENTLKYLTALPQLYEKLEYFRAKLTPLELSNLKQYTSAIDKAREAITSDDI